MSPVNKIGNLTHSVPALFDDFFTRELFNWGNSNFSATRTTVPSINIKETGQGYEVEVAAPGMEKKDFAITMEAGLLTISSAKEHSTESKDDNHIRREFSYASFQRSIALLKEVVDEQGITARYDNGILQLSIPKKQEALHQAPRKITIQ